VIITFDTGILVRATPASKGPARRLIESLANNPAHTLATSEFILGEVGKVLSYPRMEALLGIDSRGIREYLGFLRSVSKIEHPVRGLPVVLNDPSDDPIVYTAVTARADVLCALDRHLHAPNVVAFCKSRNIAVLTDLELLNRLQLLR
jgi:putative PIN family toxin of toxin-antitoxin system